MGVCTSKPASSPEETKNKSINDEINKNKLEARTNLKLLLLGAGESGKSTVFKQMQIIHNNGFTEAQKRTHIPVIRRHTVENFRDLAKGAQGLGLLTSETETAANNVVTAFENEGLHDKSVADALALWRGDELQQAFKMRSKFQLSDSAAFFLDNLQRVSSVEYMPTYEDILMCRVRTTGVSEMVFVSSGVNFRIVDVGGQRNERRKWIHCFEDVEAVLFVAALSEYDQVLFENERINRMHESLRLFEEVCNTRFFAETSMILFLNKKDLFEEKISSVDLSVCFPEYTGGCSFEGAVEFVKDKFLAKRNNKSQEVFIHVTTATSTGNMTFVFDAVKESILLQNVNNSNLL